MSFRPLSRNLIILSNLGLRVKARNDGLTLETAPTCSLSNNHHTTTTAPATTTTHRI
jgi:hypothetical protein